MFSESKHSSKLTFIKRDHFYEITQIVIIGQNHNKMIIIFKIIFSLLKYYNNEQKFLIMRFIFDFSENRFSRIKDDQILLRLIYIDYERYKLKQNRCNDKL